MSYIEVTIWLLKIIKAEDGLLFPSCLVTCLILLSRLCFLISVCGILLSWYLCLYVFFFLCADVHTCQFSPIPSFKHLHPSGILVHIVFEPPSLSLLPSSSCRRHKWTTSKWSNLILGLLILLDSWKTRTHEKNLQIRYWRTLPLVVIYPQFFE